MNRHQWTSIAWHDVLRLMVVGQPSGYLSKHCLPPSKYSTTLSVSFWVVS